MVDEKQMHPSPPNVTLTRLQLANLKKEREKAKQNQQMNGHENESERKRRAMNEWASKWFESHETEKACSPLRKNSEHEFSFLHKSIQEFFTAMHIATQLTELALQGDDEDQDEDEKRSQPLGSHLHDASDVKQVKKISNNTMNVEQKKVVNSWHRRLEIISNLQPGDASDVDDA